MSNNANHCFNILTFNHPQEELTFYYTNVGNENITRIFHKLFDRYLLKVQFKTVTKQLELLVTFEGISKVYK